MACATGTRLCAKTEYGSGDRRLAESFFSKQNMSTVAPQNLETTRHGKLEYRTQDDRGIAIRVLSPIASLTLSGSIDSDLRENGRSCPVYIKVIELFARFGGVSDFTKDAGEKMSPKAKDLHEPLL